MMHSLRPSSRFGVAAALLLSLALIGGCETVDKADKPAKLVKIKQTVPIKKAWSTSMGGAKPKLRLGLGVAVEGDRAFIAGHNGQVRALSLKTGKQLWQINTRLALSGGPGAGEGLVVVGADHGELVALDSKNGRRRWKTRINSEMLSAAVIKGEYVVLRTVDGRLHALRASDGSQVWQIEQQVPRLSLRGSATPLVVDDVAMSGFDNGRVVAVSLRDGSTVWDVAVSPPSGRTELERLVDVDSTLQVVEDDVYAVTFQGKVARLARDSGQVWWARDVSSYRGLAVDEDGVYVSNADGQIIKIGRLTGVEIWRKDTLKNRRPSAPVVIDGVVVVTDFDGVVHAFDAATGAETGRISGGGKLVSTPPAVAGGLVLFMNDQGKLTAWRVGKSRRG